MCHVFAVLSSWTARFFLAGVFFFVLTTLIGSTGGSSGTSYSGNEANRTGVATPLGKPDMGCEPASSRGGVAVAGISPSFSIVNEPEEKVCELALREGNLLLETPKVRKKRSGQLHVGSRPSLTRHWWHVLQMDDWYWIDIIDCLRFIVKNVVRIIPQLCQSVCFPLRYTL